MATTEGPSGEYEARKKAVLLMQKQIGVGRADTGNIIIAWSRTALCNKIWPKKTSLQPIQLGTPATKICMQHGGNRKI